MSPYRRWTFRCRLRCLTAAHGHPARAPNHPPVHLPRLCRLCAICRIAWWSCTWATWSSRAAPSRSSRRPITPTPKPCCRPCPLLIRGSKRSAVSSSMAIFPPRCNPPSGCPFQTRCPRKAQVEGDLCETTTAPHAHPSRTVIQIKCHLAHKPSSMRWRPSSRPTPSLSGEPQDVAAADASCAPGRLKAGGLVIRRVRRALGIGKT